MSYEEIKALSDKVNEMYNRHDADGLTALHSPDFVVHSSTLPGGVLNREGQVMMWKALWAAFPDVQNKLQDTLVDGDKVTVRLLLTGTHLGEFMGVPATGKSMNIVVVDIIRYENGLAREEWYEYNLLAMMQQLGVAPATMTA